MRINGITGIYKKTYLDNDMYRFDYSHYVDGYIDDETGEFYDEFENVVPFIRDINFLESKEILGQHGFIAYEDLPDIYEIDDEDPTLYFYSYDADSKSKILLITVVNNYEKDIKDTVVTEIDLEHIHKKAINYYVDFINDLGELTYRNIETIAYEYSIEDITKLVKGRVFTHEELNEILEIYKDPYQDVLNIVNNCNIILEEDEKGKYIANIASRDPNFDITGELNIPQVIGMLEKRQLTVDEVKLLNNYFLEYKESLETLYIAVFNEISRMDKEEKAELEENKDVEDNDEEKYSLDDLKKLKAAVKEYLVGQDEPLRRLVSELSRMKDKDFNDNVGILLSGDSGVGKTFMVQLIAKYLKLPFIRVDSTDLTVPGYVGKDLEEVLWELYENSGKDKEKAEHGIIFFDEIDKKGSNSKDDISGTGVLNHLLTLLDGADVYACKSTKGYGPQDEVKLNSKHMIIIAAGSFPDVYKDKKRTVGFCGTDEVDIPNKTPNTNVFVEKAMMSSDFMNRLPIRIRLNSLTEKDFEENFTVGKDSPLKWEEMSFSKYGVKLTVTEEFIKKASELSLKEGSGFRGSKGIILTSTSAALDDVKENQDNYKEIILTEETLDNPLVYRKVFKK